MLNDGDWIISVLEEHGPSVLKALACALEGSSAQEVRTLCEAHELPLEDVNRALVRMLAGLDMAQAAPVAAARRP